jgi:NAD(P)-dependent dehydrogenase (short-subunit alcohol dehydrogenase family)
MIEIQAAPRDYQVPAGLLAGRVILVTGASGTLGGAVALACGAAGATVVLHGRSESRLATLYDAIAAAGGAEPAILPLDFAKCGPRDFDAMADTIRLSLKRLDGIVHCAGHFTPLAPLANQPFEAWNAHLALNLTAPYAVTRACLSLLQEAPDASIVFVGESHGLRPAAYWAPIAVAKAGLAALTQVWADELGITPTIRVNLLVPGPIATRQRRVSHPGEDPKTLATPESVAPAIVYLLGEEASGVTGKALACHAGDTPGEPRIG